MEAKQIPEFDSYNIIVRLNMIYKYIIQYENLWLANKCDKLYIIKVIKNLKVIVKIDFNIYKTALNNFA